jgi:hypothetical protein
VKRVTLGILIALLVLVFAVSGGAQEKKVWGKRNIWAKELTEHLTKLYGGITQLVERGLSEELGDPDFLEKMKKEMEERFHPELIPEGAGEVEQFATDFVGYLIDTHQTLKSEWLADEAFIEELKKVTIENLSSWSRCPYALAPKLFEGWHIRALPPVRLGAGFEASYYGLSYYILLSSIEPNGPFANGEVYLLEQDGKKRLLGKIWDVFSQGLNPPLFDQQGQRRGTDRLLPLQVNNQEVPLEGASQRVLEQFNSFLDKILWDLYPGDPVEILIYGDDLDAFGCSDQRFLLIVPVAKQEKWLVLPES